MQVTETLSDGLKRAFTVVVPAADIETRRSAKLHDIAKSLRLPGFRPGKVPAPVVRKRYGTAVMAEVLEESVNEATQQMLSERGLRAAGQPKVDVVGLGADPADAARDLEFKVELELLPEIALPDFSGIVLERLRATPSEAVLADALGELAKRQQDWQDIAEDRGVATGETLVVDFAGRIGDVAFPGGTGSDMAVEIGGSGFIPGFSEQMVGMKAGESREINVTFPADYGATELAGKDAIFAINAKKLRVAQVPPVDDALAEKLGFEGGLEKLRELVAAQYQREYDQLSRLRIKRALLDALAERASFAVPDSMVEAEFTQIWQRVEADMKAGKLDAEDSAKDEPTLRADYRAIAERRVRLGLLLAEIGRVNNITVGQDEMIRAMRAEAARYPGQEQQVLDFFRKNPSAADNLRGPIFEEKVVDFILELASVSEREIGAEELAAEPEA